MIWTEDRPPPFLGGTAQGSVTRQGGSSREGKLLGDGQVST